jgi:hypothetical protein
MVEGQPGEFESMYLTLAPRAPARTGHRCLLTICTTLGSPIGRISTDSSIRVLLHEHEVGQRIGGQGPRAALDLLFLLCFVFVLFLLVLLVSVALRLDDLARRKSRAGVVAVDRAVQWPAEVERA